MLLGQQVTAALGDLGEAWGPASPGAGLLQSPGLLRGSGSGGSGRLSSPWRSSGSLGSEAESEAEKRYSGG